MSKRSKKDSGAGGATAEKPDFVVILDWIRTFAWPYIRCHKWYVALIAVLAGLYVTLRNPLKQRYTEFLSGRDDSVLATVLAFDQRSASLAVRFDKRTGPPVVITHAYLSIAPPDHSQLMPLPEPLREQATVFDKMTLMFPPNCGFAMTDGRLELVTFLLEQRSHLRLEAGTTFTNLYPAAGSLDELSKQIAAGTPVELSIHFGLVDAARRRHEVDLHLGTYTRDNRTQSLSGKSLPISASLVPSPTVTDKQGEEVLVKVTDQRTPMSLRDDKTGRIYRWQLYRNLGPHTVVVAVSDAPRELIPLVIVDQSIQLAVMFTARFEQGDSIFGGPKCFDNVLSTDGGHTRMNLASVVSTLWENAALQKDAGRVHNVTVPVNQMKLLVAEDKWTPLYALALQYRIDRAGWVKLFPAGELTQRTIQSNRVALAAARDTGLPDWTHIVDVDAFMASSTGMLVICESEFIFNVGKTNDIQFGAKYLGD